MLETSILGLKYARLVLGDVNPQEIKKLKKKYSYIYLISYKKINLENFVVADKKTPTIDLTQNLDEIFRNFSASARNKIRKTKKIESLGFVSADGNFDESYKVYAHVKRKDGVIPEPKKELKHCTYFNAYLGNKIISSISCYDFDNILRVNTIVSLRKEMGGDSRIVGYASTGLIWEICRYGKERGYKIVDLGIINLTDPSKSGIAQFKNSFGQNIVHTYIYRYETRLFKLVKKILGLAKVTNVH